MNEIDKIEISTCWDCGKLPELEKSTTGYYAYHCSPCDKGTHFQYSPERAAESWNYLNNSDMGEEDTEENPSDRT